ncbi:hypothetical protein [Buchnera aphidicola]|uniref:Uncharacterized protein n=1 Tax=Buchnera aphidicola (Aphis gossypii) TaxID=98785 RepID=A0A5J6ZCM3_9GAMM|nr:hypothetical protein [Buchnera aphidicola]QFQ31929.1 hypothetical protein FQV32_00615 [Buchnera aphidicola (Aphis gossypii)]UPT14461.1 hypothetical protein HWH54_00610 [Buchnera aphidicola (Aphis gossypii)]
MGKSNSLNIINKITNKEKEINNIFSIKEIKVLEEINKKFIEKITTYFSNFIKNNVKFNIFSIKINTYINNEQDIKYLLSTKTEILNLNKKLFIFFSDNLLSVFIDLLFGGNGVCREKINQNRNLTYIEEITNKKILKIIFSTYCKFFEKIFSIDINTCYTEIVNIKKDIVLKENYITNYFDLSLNGIKVFFSILLPVSVIKKYFQELNPSKRNSKDLTQRIDFEKNFPIFHLHDIELKVIIKLITSSQKKYNSLSVGDILIVENPEKVIAYIEKIPIFLGCYKNFNKKSVIFFKKFIYKI